MSDQYFNNFVPWTDASSAPSRMSQWWVSKADGIAEIRSELSKAAAADDEFSAAWPLRALRWTRGLVSRIPTRSDSETRDELFAFARKVENELPNLAGELRFIASHRPNAPD